MWYVYILLCTDNTFYTGISNNPKKRFETHKAGKGAKYTRSHKPIKIVYLEKFPTKQDVMKREREIKNLHRNKKEILVQNNTIDLSSI